MSFSISILNWKFGARIGFKVNEPRYERCGVTHSSENEEIAAENFAEAGSVITIDNDCRS